MSFNRTLWLAGPLVAGAAIAAEDPRGAGPAWTWADPEGDGQQTDVGLADVNGDGRLDVLVFDPVVDAADPSLDEAGRVRVFMQGATMTGTPDLVLGVDHGVPGGASVSTGSWGDVNGDGAADQLTWMGDASARDRHLQVRVGGPGGLAAIAQQVMVDDASVPWRYGAKVPVGPIEDVNGDGFGDALLRAFEQGQASGPQHLALHLGSAAGLTSQAAWRWELDGPGFVDARAQIVGDVDMDGFRDLVWVDLYDIPDLGIAGSLNLVRGDEDGFRDVWWTSILLPAGISSLDGYEIIDVGDMTLDGRADVALMVRPDDPAQPAQLLLYVGDSAYGFTFFSPLVLWSEVTTARPWMLGVGDFDGNAHADLALGLPGAAGLTGPPDGVGQVRLILDADFGSTPSDRYFLASPGETDLAVRGAMGDVDGDGLADLALVTGAGPGGPGTVSLHLGFDDWDLDGSDAAADCAPLDPAVHPGAEELWYDGVDQDCDGVDDDQDGDGSVVDLDCNDEDAGVGPGVAEVWYDGIDQDCDGNDADQDLDGAVSDEHGGDDCDDLSPRIGPGAVDLPSNGVDEDCDGVDATEDFSTVECGCSQGADGSVAWIAAVALLFGRRRRRS